MLGIYSSGIGKKLFSNSLHLNIVVNYNINNYCSKRLFSINNSFIKNNNENININNFQILFDDYQENNENNNNNNNYNNNINNNNKINKTNKTNDIIDFFSKLKWLDGKENDDSVSFKCDETNGFILPPKIYDNNNNNKNNNNNNNNNLIEDEENNNIEILKQRKRFEFYNSLKPKITEKDIEKIFKISTEQKSNDSLSGDYRYLLESIQTCIDRFSFLIKPKELKVFDIVMVYNDKPQLVSLGYIESIDELNDNITIIPHSTIGSKVYSKSEIYACLPLSIQRENFGELYSEFLRSLLDMNIITSEEFELESSNLLQYLQMKEGFNDPMAIINRNLELVNYVIEKTKGMDFFSKREAQFLNKFWKSTNLANDSILNKVVNGVPIIGSIDSWNLKMNLQNELELNEASRKFYENIRYNSPWSDVILYFSLISKLSSKDYYKLKSKDFFQFTKEEELKTQFNHIEFLQEEATMNYILIFQKYCLDFLVTNIGDGNSENSPFLNENSKSILNNQSIPLLSNHILNSEESLLSYRKTDPNIPSEFFTKYLPKFIELLHYNYYTTLDDEIYGENVPKNKLNETINNYLLGEYVLSGKLFTEPLCTNLFVRFKPYKTSTEYKLFYNDSIHLKDLPKINKNRCTPLEDDKRYIIKKTSFSFLDNNYNSNCDFNYYGEEKIRISSPESSIGILNQRDNNYLVFINIPDFSDCVEKRSSLDTISMLRSKSVDLPNRSYKMLPTNILKYLKLYEDKKIGFNEKKYRKKPINFDETTINPYYFKVGFDESYKRGNGNRCISLLIKFNCETHEIMSYDVVPSMVHNININTFNKLQKVIDDKLFVKGGSIYDLLKLSKIAKTLKKRRTSSSESLKNEIEIENKIENEIKFEEAPIEENGVPISEEEGIVENIKLKELVDEQEFQVKYIFNKSKMVKEKEIIKKDIIDPNTETRMIYNEFKYLTNHLIAKYSLSCNINTIPLIVPKEIKDNYLENQEFNSNNNNGSPLITYPNNDTGYDIYTNVFSPFNNYLDLYVLRELKAFKAFKSRSKSIKKQPIDQEYSNYAKSSIFPYLERNLSHINSFEQQNNQEWSNLYNLQLQFKQQQEQQQNNKMESKKKRK
ncbi:hypothetical protein RB653_008337 [Dictyostelium firmibasis]|uniref:RNB domain-containing protein n=1 Tax=Dictyostelium firmibasis TaxID=79012 RepID=A0AAN7TSF9_9MYCE